MLELSGVHVRGCDHIGGYNAAQASSAGYPFDNLIICIKVVQE
jgi:hypothetical protein